MTKEELIIEASENKAYVQRLLKEDKEQREEFARAFKWFKKKGVYDSEEEVYFPSWVEIFIKLGKVLTRKDFADFEEDIRTLQADIKNLKFDTRAIEELNK